MDAKKTLDTLLDTMVDKEGSDLHLKNGVSAKYRVHGEIESINDEPMADHFLEDIIKIILTRDQQVQLEKERQFDGHYVNSSDIRFRLNVFYHLKGYAFVFRVIATDIIPLEKLGLPDAVQKCVEMRRGLVLVTGTTGSGKSTTLAGIIDAINRDRKHHIITIEDPVEFVHSEKLCILEQRNIGEHANSFHDALRAAMREDPDIILVGEMRDMSTVETALHAANTGHLVFSTLHTLDAKETINRIVGIFPSNEQNRIRMTLGSVLQATIAQRLVKKIDGGRKAAVEILFNTERIRQLILDGRDDEITDAIEEGSIHGMQTFNQALFQMYRNKEASLENLLTESGTPNNLLLMIRNSEEDAAAKQGFDLKMDHEEEVGEDKKFKKKPEPIKLKLKR